MNLRKGIVCLLSIISLHLRRRCDWSDKCLRIEKTTSLGCALKKEKILAKHHTFPNYPLITFIRFKKRLSKIKYLLVSNYYLSINIQLFNISLDLLNLKVAR